MTLLDSEVVKLKGRNKCKKSNFILLSMLTSLHVFFLALIVAYVTRYYVQWFTVLIISMIVYLFFVIYQTNASYKNYSKFFGQDEIVITEERVYYNVCMNKKGNYINYDSYVLIKDINFVQIKKGLYPQRVSISFNDYNEYINIHCLDNAKEIAEYLSCLIDKK